MYVMHSQFAFQKPCNSDSHRGLVFWLWLMKTQSGTLRFAAYRPGSIEGRKALATASWRNMLNLMQLSPGAHADDMILCGESVCFIVVVAWRGLWLWSRPAGQQAIWSKGHARLDKRQSRMRERREEGKRKVREGPLGFGPRSRGRGLGCYIVQTAWCTHRNLI